MSAQPTISRNRNVGADLFVAPLVPTYGEKSKNKEHGYFDSRLARGATCLRTLVCPITFDLFAKRGQVRQGHTQALSRVEHIEVIAFHFLRAVGEVARPESRSSRTHR